ncbi:dTMP kinase [Enterovirga sp.]|uniref:dTMP kinase n=1 Tax=Enterovirga sp. TaxID=2026350 RepID=UPI002D09BEB4|nr:dTMP kinase [Enterovirga sp.]HMO31059.1 dTMP kinase [Enterovirga sp.]
MAGPTEASSTRGVFVSFEGGEGAGKSTQIGRIRARLEAAGRAVVTTREPGGSHRAERIRAILLEAKAKRLKETGEAILFAAARLDHVDTLVAPALREGKIVLCDRFVDSTRVYQGAVAGIEPGFLARLEAAAAGGTTPDLTFVIDVPVPVGLARARSRREARGEPPDRFEGEGAAYHEKVRAAFLAIAAAEPERCVVVDGAASADEVSAAIWSALAPRIKGRAG